MKQLRGGGRVAPRVVVIKTEVGIKISRPIGGAETVTKEPGGQA